tara:strand:+ start:349 stop:996 length:648 start_codon:yes stop_codon:yes gene_type:complete
MDHSKMENFEGGMDHSKMDHSKMDHSKMDMDKDPCTGSLSEVEYLEHMIPHHQVAIDMSDLLLPKSKNPTILHLCRDITRKQSYEIWEMTMLKNKINGQLTDNSSWTVDCYETKLEKFWPKLSKSKDGSCNPLFFKPNEHMKMMEDMEINDKSYLEHMIPHHQVAVDMSKRLLLHTNNSYLLDFCRKLITDQQGEIFYMNNLLMNHYDHESELLG